MGRKRTSSKRKTGNIVAVAVLAILASIIYFGWYRTREIPIVKFTPPTPFVSFGIDVSHHQGTIDWQTVSNACDTQLCFVYVKATEGRAFLDKQFTTNAKALASLQIPFGAYHFFRPGISASEQAKHFLKTIKKSGTTLPAVVDVEILPRDENAFCAAIKIWLDHVEKSQGTQPIIYTSYHMYSTLLKERFPNHRFWIAHYTRNGSHLGEDRIVHWQYSEEGEIPGITSFVDLNYSKQLFRRKPSYIRAD